MKYNFDEIIARGGNRSAKYDERAKKFGTADVIPLWVADMDFRTAQPIIDACVSKAEEATPPVRTAIFRRCSSGSSAARAGRRTFRS